MALGSIHCVRHTGPENSVRHAVVGDFLPHDRRGAIVVSGARRRTASVPAAGNQLSRHYIRLLAHDGAQAKLTVSDCRQGVIPNKLDRALGRFYRGVGAPVAGSGSGPTTVRRIARLHHAMDMLMVDADYFDQLGHLVQGRTVRLSGPGLALVTAAIDALHQYCAYLCFNGACGVGSIFLS